MAGSTFAASGWIPPGVVLPSRPVTARDLALALSAADAAVGRVLVYPRRGAEAGLYDLHVVPAADADPAAALKAVRRAFHAGRNLCEDFATLALAVAVPCRLEARVEINRHHAPERVAALIYDRCRRLMRDRAAVEPRAAASRRDAFEEPALLYGRVADPDGGAAGLDAFFAALTGLDEVEDVTALAFRRLDAPERDPFAPLGPGAYRELVLPRSPEEVGLVLASRNLEIRFDLAGMHDEIARLRADHLARMSDPLDRADWAPVAAGRRRDFRHVPLGLGLPGAYGAGPERLPRSASPAVRAAAGRLRGYLALGDALLAGAAADLEGLPELFAADLGDRRSYLSRPMDFGPAPELAVAGSDAVAEAVARLDPWHERKGRVLDYLLALHGEEASQNSLRQHDLYRGAAGRRDAILANRVRLLAEVAALNRDRAAAPDVPGGERGQAVGLGRKLALLLDFPDRGTRPLAAALTRSGLVVVEGTGPDGDWRVPRRLVPAAVDPFVTLVERVEAPPLVDARALIEGAAFLRSREIGADVLRRGVLGEAWVLAPEAAGSWRLFLDPGENGEVLDVARFESRVAAVVRANQLRRFLTELNRQSEGVHLVEDVLLRGSGGFAPLTLTAVFSGWSARAATPEFRNLAEESLALAPASARRAPRALARPCGDAGVRGARARLARRLSGHERKISTGRPRRCAASWRLRSRDGVTAGHRIGELIFDFAFEGATGGFADPEALARRAREALLPAVEAACVAAGERMVVAEAIAIDLGRLADPVDWAALARTLAERLGAELGQGGPDVGSAGRGGWGDPAVAEAASRAGGDRVPSVARDGGLELAIQREAGVGGADGQATGGAGRGKPWRGRVEGGRARGAGHSEGGAVG